MNSPALTHVKDRFTEGGRVFLRWWLAELKGLVPPGLRRRLPKASQRAVWDLSGGTARVWRPGGGWRTADGRKAEKPARKVPAAVDVIADPALVFRKPITLPRMSVTQARAALRLQLSRHVPFRAADIVFDCRIMGEDVEAGTITAELALMRRADRAALMERLSEYGITPKRIGLATEGPEPRLLFDFRERAQSSRFTRIHGLLALLAAMLALAALFAIEDRRAAELAAWRDAAAEQARAAAGVKRLRNDLIALEARTAFLRRQRQAVPRIELLEVVSKALPDDTWLESVEITGSKIRLTGYSDQASSVPEWLQKTGKVTDLHFVSAVSSTAKSGVDRFDMEGVVP